MLYLMLLAHLLGDYLFQWNSIARWKARSLAGVLVHGGIVTLTTLVCAVVVTSSWWPYALLIGLTHTLIDLVRTQLLRPKHPAWELTGYLGDQLAHLAVIALVVTWSGLGLWADRTGALRPLADRRVLIYALGYVLLLNPSWVLLRFAVRGVWGPDASPILEEGQKYGPMVERVVIATCVLTGRFYLAPLVLLPRRLTSIRMQGRGVGLSVRSTGHWAETVLSVVLAVVVGLALRMLNGGGG